MSNSAKILNIISVVVVLVTFAGIIIRFTEIFSEEGGMVERPMITQTTKTDIVYDTLASDDKVLSSTDKVISGKDAEHELKSATNAADLMIQKFWVKVLFSGIFCVAALFVILSKKYDDETKKWAFSILTLISGIWIGTLAQ